MENEETIWRWPKAQEAQQLYLDAARSEAARQVLARLAIDLIELGLVRRPSVLVKSHEEPFGSSRRRLVEHLAGSPYAGLGSASLLDVNDHRRMAQHVVNTYWNFWSARLSRGTTAVCWSSARTTGEVLRGRRSSRGICQLRLRVRSIWLLGSNGGSSRQDIARRWW